MVTSLQWQLLPVVVCAGEETPKSSCSSSSRDGKLWDGPKACCTGCVITELALDLESAVRACANMPQASPQQVLGI